MFTWDLPPEITESSSLSPELQARCWAQTRPITGLDEHGRNSAHQGRKDTFKIWQYNWTLLTNFTCVRHLRASACTVMFVLYKVLSTLPHSLNHYWGGCPRCLLARTAQVFHYRNHVRGWQKPTAVLGKWALLDPSTSLSPNRTPIHGDHSPPSVSKRSWKHTQQLWSWTTHKLLAKTVSCCAVILIQVRQI